MQSKFASSTDVVLSKMCSKRFKFISTCAGYFEAHQEGVMEIEKDCNAAWVLLKPACNNSLCLMSR